MSSFAIFRALLVYIQGEAHPLYIAERTLTSAPRATGRTARFGYGVLFFFLLIVLAVASYLRSSGTIVTGSSTDLVSLTPPALVIGWLISMGWTVPLAMYAGYAISRERAAQTWDSLQLSPYTSSEILLTKAAASIRGVWGTALSVALTVMVLRMAILSVLLVMSASAGELALIFAVFLIPVAIVIVVVEIIQEIALSVVIGLVVGLSNLSPRMTMFVGAVGGFMLRMVQLSIIWWLLTHVSVTVYVALSATISGSTILLPAISGIISLPFVLILAAGREGLIRILLAWTLRRTHEG